MQAERKKILLYALDYDIKDVQTYAGYKGDLVLKITTNDKNAMLAIRKFALDLGILEVVVKHIPPHTEYEIYCVTQEENVYHVKMDDDKKRKEKQDDIWSKTILN